MSLGRGVCSCAKLQVFLVTEAERKNVRRRARFQQHGGASYHQVLFLQGKAQQESHAILTETLGEHAPSYAIVRNWVIQFKRGDFATRDVRRCGRPKTVTTSETDHTLPLLQDPSSAMWHSGLDNGSRYDHAEPARSQTHPHL